MGASVNGSDEEEGLVVTSPDDEERTVAKPPVRPATGRPAGGNSHAVIQGGTYVVYPGYPPGYPGYTTSGPPQGPVLTSSYPLCSRQRREHRGAQVCSSGQAGC